MLIKIYGVGVGCVVDLCYIELVVCMIVEVVMMLKIIVEKLMILVKIVEVIKEIFSANMKGIKFVVFLNFEFFVEGMVVVDLISLDCVLIGGEWILEGEVVMKMLVDVYVNWVLCECIIMINFWLLEFFKLVVNVFLV